MSGGDSTATRYEAALRDVADLTRNQTKANVAVRNRVVHDAQDLYLRLRETTDGRRQIERLASDPDRLVRLHAAAHCLKWNPALGRAILEDIRDSHAVDGPGWDVAGFNAKWTLKTFDAGTLDLDWEPQRPS